MREPHASPPSPSPPRDPRRAPAQTILYSSATSIFLLDEHHSRLLRTADALGFACATLAELRARILAHVGAESGRAAHRLRVVGLPDGSLAVTSAPLPLPHRAFPAADCAAAPLRIALDRLRVDTSCANLRFKTTARKLYDDARARVGCGAVGAAARAPTASASSAAPSAPPGPFDVLLVNARDEVTEAGIANVALEHAPGQPWLTPPLSCGLVEGVMRRELLRSGQIVEAVVTAERLLAAAADRARAVGQAGEDGGWYPRIYCFNAVRGVYEVVLDPDDAASAATTAAVAVPPAQRCCSSAHDDGRG